MGPTCTPNAIGRTKINKQFDDDGSVNALAESTIGQIKTELIKPHGPWRTIDQLEYALFEYLDWWNHRRLHGQIAMVPPAEAEATHYRQSQPLDRAGSQ
jgi:putative transposase